MTGPRDFEQAGMDGFMSGIDIGGQYRLVEHGANGAWSMTEDIMHQRETRYTCSNTPRR